MAPKKAKKAATRNKRTLKITLLRTSPLLVKGAIVGNQQWMVSNMIIVETMESSERRMNIVSTTLINPH